MTAMENGASMHADVRAEAAAVQVEPPKPAVKTPVKTQEYVTRSVQPIKPDETGTAPHKMKFAGTIVDVTSPDGFEITRIAFSRRLLELADGETARTALAREPYEANAGEFVMVGVRNGRSLPMAVAATIHVANEHGPEAAPSVFRVMSPEAAATQKQRAGSGGNGGGPREPRPLQPMPVPPMPETAHLRKPKGSGSGSATTATRPAAEPAQAMQRKAPAVASLPSGRKKKTNQRGRSGAEARRKVWVASQRAKAAEIASAKVAKTEAIETAASVAGTELVAASSALATIAGTVVQVEHESTEPVCAIGESPATVVLFVGHAESLRIALEDGVPLVGQPRAAVIYALKTALDREGGEAVANEVAVAMSRDAAAALDEAFGLRRERMLERDVLDVLIRPLRVALGMEIEVEAAAGLTEADEETASSSVPADLETAPALEAEDSEFDDDSTVDVSENESGSSTALAPVLSEKPNELAPDDGRPE